MCIYYNNNNNNLPCIKSTIDQIVNIYWYITYQFK